MIDLLTFTESGGCSSKIPPAVLENVLSDMILPDDPRILVGIATGDDAAVYRFNDTESLILTTDFFPPVCSDPYEFGQIAAANSLSDVYAMGGKPLVALNIIMFPTKTLPLDAYRAIIQGGADKAREGRCPIVGGHSIDDPIPKYGLAVTGLIQTEQVTANNRVKPGDQLILTKPVGTGIITAAKKSGMVKPEDYSAALASMKQLNAGGAEIMNILGVHAATDITGFGLAGHAFKLARESGVSIVINAANVPLLPGSLEYADSGCIPCGCFKNEDYIADNAEFSITDFNLRSLMLDPQTSGGLLIACSKDKSAEALRRLTDAGYAASSIIGEAEPKQQKLVRFL